jgi:radical SAM protein with 4Fe4S-binding SPASM domain
MNKPHCIVPWIYFFAEANGDVMPCCVNNTFLGNIQVNDYKKVWNSHQMKKFRRKMLDGELPKTCEICIENKTLTDDVNNTYNLKDYYNNFFKSSFDEIEKITNEDGSIKEDEIKFKAFSFKVSNKCNFKCRMCNAYNSSLIAGGVIENGEFYKSFVKENINDLELIEFIGGESFLMEETYDILQYLIDRNKPHPHLHFNTNMSVLSLGDRNIFDYLEKLDISKVEIVASVDELDERAEYIRKGCNWKSIEKNLKKLSKKDFKTNTNIVASCYNVFRLPEIITRLVDIGHINEKHNYENFMFNPVIGDCDIILLSDEFKNKIMDKLYNFIAEYNKTYNVDISYKFKIIIGKLKQELPDNINELRVQFLYENHKKDKKRGEKLLKTIPEMKDVVYLLKNGN